jgi:hypothetical protein
MAAKRTDWTEMLRQIRLRLDRASEPISEYEWAAALTEYDLRFLKTLRIEA